MRRTTLLVLSVLLLALPTSNASSGQAASPAPRFVSGLLDAGSDHTCALLDTWEVRCWGDGGDGRLGHANTDDVGDDEDPHDYGPVELGAGRTARAITAGSDHTCALLDNGRVRCWGFGGSGRLGYGNIASIGDNETPGSVGTVDLGAGRTARAITAGGFHTCALLDNGRVRCWGFAGSGQLGYGNTAIIGDNETPGSVGTVDLGAGRTARAITAGSDHTCALLDNGRVRCWGFGGTGRLGYGNIASIGDNETPGSAGPVDLGAGRTARAVSAGSNHTCALLDNGRVRCWGSGGVGQLGYGNTNDIGDNEAPGSVVPVNLGAGRTARAISAAGSHTCALLDSRRVRCWGWGDGGRLGYGNTNTIGDDEPPGSVGPVDLGAGRTARAISAAGSHTCALLDNGRVRCWGLGDNGRLGYGNTNTIGDDETPGPVGPLSLEGLIFVRGKPGLTLAPKPKRDARLPISFRALGRLKPPTGPPLDEACSGTVRITVKRGTKAVKKAKAKLGIRNGGCVYSKRIRFNSRATLQKAKKLKILARFPGNELLVASSAPARTVRIT